ncbi:Threonine/homoserine/homoserine lactone efflux protein [Cohaesibacter sp. ES.047]|uniref:LysE family translocator n=1 Tax=Cohaesibacter sp. ES.047 TaxID=1798205 RepID=UPI000BB9B91E|nr:LysE family translocator [Cohaesibacter sp. ES.047]SNY94333.1 Threonine/homoserine/homoserine lactone efflux protein [Cohaesibacter sp. ES.047]
MTYENALALILFAFATSITPGPNNLMLMASGANFGLVRSLPHLLGVSLGFVFMTSIVGAGLSEFLTSNALLSKGLQVVCMVFVLYLAWRIVNATPPDNPQSAQGRPMRFIEAAAFQWVNPKAIAMAITTTTAYIQEQTYIAIALAGLIFALVNLPSCGLWVILGQQMRRLLHSRRSFFLFNLIMATLLVLSMLPVVLGLADS